MHPLGWPWTKVLPLPGKTKRRQSICASRVEGIANVTRKKLVSKATLICMRENLIFAKIWTMQQPHPHALNKSTFVGRDAPCATASHHQFLTRHRTEADIRPSRQTEGLWIPFPTELLNHYV